VWLARDFSGFVTLPVDKPAVISLYNLFLSERRQTLVSLNAELGRSKAD